MPNRIPTTVFIRHAALHVLNMFVTWCRGILVASVWLLVLPWCMRVVWRSLFWVGDGGWTNDMLLDPPFALAASQMTLSDTNITHNLANASIIDTVANETASGITGVESSSTAWALAKAIFLRIPWPFAQFIQIVQLTQYPTLEMNSTALNSTSNRATVRSPSLLSDVPFLNWFQSQTMNRCMIDVMEGQIITLFVVVAFILIFLIREWVVQQQPVINMAALGGNAADERPVQPNNPVPEARAVDGPADHMAEERPDDVQDQNSAVDINETERPEPTIRRVRRSSSLRRRRDDIMRRLEADDMQKEIKDVLRSGSAAEITEAFGRLGIADSSRLQDFIATALDEYQSDRETSSLHDASDPNSLIEDDGQGSGPSNGLMFPTSGHLDESASNPFAEDGGQSSSRPHMPTRDRSSMATGIRRGIEEGNSWSFASLPQAQAPTNSQAQSRIQESWHDAHVDSHRPDHLSPTVRDEAGGSEHSSESWQQVPDVTVSDDSDQALEGARLQDKGKARANFETPSELVMPDRRTQEPFIAPAACNTDGNESNAETMDEWPQNSQTSGAGRIAAVPVETSSEHGSEDGHDESEGSTEFSEDDSDLPAELLQLVQDQEESLDDAPVTPEELPRAQAIQPVHAPANTVEALLDWMFGDIAPATLAPEEAGNDERIVRNVADEAPFVPFIGNEPRDHGNAPIQDAEVAAAAAQAGIDANDQEAIDDAEDLEGILELIGMQGPIVGLFQNALFSAVLISATLACAVWIPYLWGKMVLLLMGSPISLLIKFPLQLIATMTDLIVDVTLFLVAGMTYGLSVTVSILFRLFTTGKVSQTMQGVIGKISSPAQLLTASAMERIAKLLTDYPLQFSSDHFRLSVNSHASLRSIQNSTSFALNETGNFVNAIVEEIAADSPLQFVWRIMVAIPVLLQTTMNTIYVQSASLFSWLWASKSYKVTLNLDLGNSTTEAYTAMEYWTATDRLIAILAGYGFFALAGAVYLKRGAPFSTTPQGQRIERIISDVLQQAGGVLKVILIISIEMLAFPLYCGLLLDLAMLPLFKDATLYTRWQFACNSPWTSGFVHWFIGTCYMFHFALFVSMCRKIMRKGVLYFIRDPDDPTFHPVRDVLERSVTTQLRKIAFSALVYGALVIVCLGGVVWTLSRVTSEVLPIHWTTEAPSLEFPLDLLFYNFLTPVIIKFYKPSDGLHAIYSWWFKTCAGFLRLSNFLFGDKMKEQEQPGGKYVRAPASDQTRIPKGQAVFVEVTAEDVRKDGITEGGVHNNPDLVTVVYIPPWFRVRIFCFVVTIWLFMGLSGVSVTILPLLFGRFLFSLFLPPTVEMNDIHAFSLGIYTLGSIMYSLYSLYKLISTRIHRPAPDALSTFNTIAITTRRVGGRVLRFSYVWTSLIFAIPFLFAVLIELYFLMPLHAYLGPKEPHVVHIIQDWTLGFLYARLAARLIFANRNSRPARAFSAVVRDGYLYPNAAIATRCFVLPVLAIFLVAIAIPSSISFITNRTLYWGASEATKKLVWRFSFPAVGMSLVVLWISNAVIRLLVRWRLVVKDEVYLIGERLHNFGERKAPEPAIRDGSIVAQSVGDGDVLVH